MKMCLLPLLLVVFQVGLGSVIPTAFGIRAGYDFNERFAIETRFRKELSADSTLLH